jgi:ABC-2 type transport system ATP-binding protein
MPVTGESNGPVLVVRGLSYSYKKTQAVRSASFTVEAGSIHGFVGPNGAGKTTTLKVLATLLRAQRGQVEVFGHDIVKGYREVRRAIGYMPDHFGLYPQMTVFECLDFFAAAYGLPAGRRDSVIGDILRLTDMAGRRDSLVRTLSRGMVQRLSLGRALVNDPRLLLLDEPASGLDPRARIELMEILKELGRLGKAIFISSHILGELADLCDSVTIIDRGEIKYSGPMSGLLAQQGGAPAYVIGLEAESPAAEAALRQLQGVREVVRLDRGPSYRVVFEGATADTTAMLTAVLQAGGRIASLREDRRELSQAFMDLTEPGVPS